MGDLTLSEWKADFKGYINALNMPKDDYNGIMEYIDEVPSAQPEIIRCKDCRKHNISVGYQKDCCPLYHYRGMSFGGEHDLQFCSYAERREE